MLPDIDSLALFVRAAELHSLTKAATASNMGVAAASRRIALLEDRFKTALLARSAKGVDLTPAGASLLVHAKALLAQVNQMQADMNDHAAGRKGVLRVMANTSAMTESLPNDLAAFSRANKDVRLVVEERWSAEVARAVSAGEADVGVVVEGLKIEGLDLIPYRSDRIAVVVPKDHALARRVSFTFLDVLDHDIVALESGSSMMRLLFEQAVVVAGRALQLRIQVRSFEAVCRTVQSGLGVGILPFESASVLCPAMDLVARPLPEPWARRTMLICVRKDRAASTPIARLLEHLSASVGT